MVNLIYFNIILDKEDTQVKKCVRNYSALRRLIIYTRSIFWPINLIHIKSIIGTSRLTILSSTMRTHLSVNRGKNEAQTEPFQAKDVGRLSFVRVISLLWNVNRDGWGKVGCSGITPEGVELDWVKQNCIRPFSSDPLNRATNSQLTV